MNSILFSITAAGTAALSNLFFRKNSTNKDHFSTHGYLLFFYLISFLSSFILYPNLLSTKINYGVLCIGIFVGFLNISLMLMTHQALKKGPSGLTFAFQNASAVFPAILLFILFGEEFGYTCTYNQILGLALVLCGLFYGAKKGSNFGLSINSAWLKFVLACFVVQVCALTIIQGRCLFIDLKDKGVFTFLSYTKSEDMWFMPGLFGSCLITQLFFFLKEKRKLHEAEILYGCLGGMANFGSTMLLLLATRTAAFHEKNLIFPCFAVATIFFCNCWSNWLYKEKFNVKSNVLCTSGILISFI